MSCFFLTKSFLFLFFLSTVPKETPVFTPTGKREKTKQQEASAQQISRWE